MADRLSAWIQTILALGVSRASDESQLRYIRMCNYLALIALAIMSLFISNYLLSGDVSRASVQIIIILATLLPVFLLNHLGFFSAAKYSILLACCLSTIFDAAAGGSVEGHQYFFIVIASVFALLNEPNNWRAALVGYTTPFLCWLVLEYTDYNLLSWLFPIQSMGKLARFESIFLSYWIVPIIIWRYSYVSMISDKRAGRADKMAALGEMAAGMGHEINNPLAIIKGKIRNLKKELGKNEIDADNLREKLDQINEACDRISKIIVSIRYFSRDSSEDPLEVISVPNLIKSTLELCALKAQETHVQLKSTENLDCHLKGRESEIMQILINLISNAIYEVSKLEERWVEVGYEITPGYICIKVTDSGTGIPAHISSRMMQAFFSTKEPGTGTGLGLSISKSLAERNYGTLTYIESCPNTQFELRIPRHNLQK